eukprot:360965-Chlamydomonas_euryale.AAC.2
MRAEEDEEERGRGDAGKTRHWRRAEDKEEERMWGGREARRGVGGRQKRGRNGGGWGGGGRDAVRQGQARSGMTRSGKGARAVCLACWRQRNGAHVGSLCRHTACMHALLHASHLTGAVHACGSVCDICLQHDDARVAMHVHAYTHANKQHCCMHTARRAERVLHACHTLEGFHTFDTSRPEPPSCHVLLTPDAVAPPPAAADAATPVPPPPRSGTRSVTGRADRGAAPRVDAGACATADVRARAILAPPAYVGSQEGTKKHPNELGLARSIDVRPCARVRPAVVRWFIVPCAPSAGFAAARRRLRQQWHGVGSMWGCCSVCGLCGA